MNALPIAHVGIAVPDLDRAIAWYADAFGFEPIGAPVEVTAHDGHAGTVAADVFGPAFGGFRQAQLATANCVGVELFQFEHRPRSGLMHLCLVSREVESLAERIAASGGRRRTSRAWPIFAGEPYLTCFCEDPFGNVVELYSHSHERTYANR